MSRFEEFADAIAGTGVWFKDANHPWQPRQLLKGEAQDVIRELESLWGDESGNYREIWNRMTPREIAEEYKITDEESDDMHVYGLAEKYGWNTPLYRSETLHIDWQQGALDPAECLLRSLWQRGEVEWDG